MSKKKNKKSSGQYTTEVALKKITDTANKILKLYYSNEDMMENEAKIFRYVQKNGETEALHMFYYSSIAAFVFLAADTYRPICFYCQDDESDDYGNTFVIDAIATTIYWMRKDALGLSGMNISEMDFSFEVAAGDRITSEELDSTKAIMDCMVENGIALLNDLHIERVEEILTPAGVMSQTFAFYKILTQVMLKMDRTVYLQVQEFGMWVLIVVCYEVAARVYKSYISQKKQAAEAGTTTVA